MVEDISHGRDVSHLRRVGLRLKNALAASDFLLPRPEISLHIGLTFGIYSLPRHTLPGVRLAPGNRKEVRGLQNSPASKSQSIAPSSTGGKLAGA